MLSIKNISISSKFNRFKKLLLNFIFLFIIILITINCAGMQIGEANKAYRIQEGMSFEFEGRPRNYIVHTPNDYDSRKEYPLLLAFHGARSNAKDMQKMTGLNTVSDKEKFIVVYPYGSTNLQEPSFFWNAFDCCGYAVENKIDDIGFVKRLIEVLKEDYSIDNSKIYSTGFSNGAMMSIKLACELSEEFSAIAAIGGAMFDKSCNPSRPLPILFVQGLEDKVVPYEGGVGVNSSTKKAKLPAKVSFEYWTRMHGCEDTKSKEDSKKFVYISSSCNNGAEVKLVSVKKEKHTWPEENYPATQEIWSFLKKWSKPKKKIPV